MTAAERLAKFVDEDKELHFTERSDIRAVLAERERYRAALIRIGCARPAEGSPLRWATDIAENALMVRLGERLAR